MPVDAFIHLDTVRCLAESDGARHSEPYVWPVLLWTDSALIGSGQYVGATSLGTGQGARAIVRNDILPVDRAPMPAVQHSLSHRFEHGLTLRSVGIVVAMLEADETSDSSVRMSYDAFVRELPVAVADLVRANLRERQSDAEIRSSADIVTPQDEGAGSDRLSAWTTFEVAIGSLNLGDQMALATHVVDVVEGMPPSSFTFQFRLGPDSCYEISGRVELRVSPSPDRCQAERDRVQAAQSALDGLRAMLAERQEELQHVSPSEKPGILRMIRQIRTEEIPPAQVELDAAHQALTIGQVASSGRMVTPAFHSL